MYTNHTEENLDMFKNINRTILNYKYEYKKSEMRNVKRWEIINTTAYMRIDINKNKKGENVDMNITISMNMIEKQIWIWTEICIYIRIGK